MSIEKYIKVITDHSERLKSTKPEIDHLGRTYAAALGVLSGHFGLSWAKLHVMETSAPTNFFQNDWATDARRNLHTLRTVSLAEMIVNLGDAPGYEAGPKQKLLDGEIEAGFTEIEVARILYMGKVPFRFRKRSQRKGEDYDFDMLIGGEEACGEAKCKIEDTARSVGTVVNSLSVARRQLPKDKPGFIFIRLPQTWNPDGTDDTHLDDMEEIATGFFRGGNQRVVSLMFYFGLGLAFDRAGAAVIMTKQFKNPAHRFRNDIDWMINIEQPVNWISLTSLTA